MRHFVIGDVHGIPEVADLVSKFAPSTADKIIFVGDLFDRGFHAHVVWDVVKQTKAEVTMGNHEYKTLHWLQGRRDWLPSQYYLALNLLIANGVTPQELLDWHGKLPLLLKCSTELGKEFIVTHAAIDTKAPYEENVSINVFGNMEHLSKMPRPDVDVSHDYFWDRWEGSQLVIYGHLVTGDGMPRLRRNKAHIVNSIGLDTAAVHGGGLTGYCVEEDRFYQVPTKDWGMEVKEIIKKFPLVVDSGLIKFVLEQREKLRVAP